jgi:hypothetical protein
MGVDHFAFDLYDAAILFAIDAARGGWHREE